MTMISVRRAAPEDKPAIFEFLKLAYAGRWQFKLPERWEWQFERNPYRRGDPLPVWIAVDDAAGKVVGQSCAMLEPLTIGGSERRAAWGVDFFVLPEYRQQGIGRRLQQTNRDAHEIFMSVSMAEAARRIKASLEMTPLEPAAVFTRLARYEPESVTEAVVKRLGVALPKTLAGWLAAGLNVLLDLRDRRLQNLVDKRLTLERVYAFGAEFDRLWEAVSPHFHALVRRDAAFLEWKYRQQPHVRYACLLARRGGEPCGYVIFRVGQPPERRLGIIADLFAAPSDGAAIRSLLAAAILYCKRQRVKDIVAASTIPAYQHGLVSLGFRRVKAVTPMFYCRLESAEIEAALQPGAWLLGKSDQDWDQYPLGG